MTSIFKSRLKEIKQSLSFQKVPFEILRRNDGRVALSVNAGVFQFKPQKIQAIHNGLVILGNEPKQNAMVVCLDSDIWRWLQKNRSLRLYEFSSMGLFSSHLLDLVVIEMA